MTANLEKEEIIQAFSVPSVTCNHFLINVFEQSVRIAFGEKIDISENIYYRSAVVLSKEDALAMHELLGKLLTPQENT